MKHRLFLLLVFCSFSFSNVLAKESSKNDSPLFKENKGQVVDQHNKLRSDILFSGSSDGLSYFFRKNGISYQLYKPGEKEGILVSRIDMAWIGANSNAKVVTKNKAVTTDNFYNVPCNNDGVTGVENFGDIQYENVYQGVDLHFYYKNGSLKYDFIVEPYTDYKKIQIKIDGATSIKQHKDGTISIVTPSGTMTEGLPVAYQLNKEIKTDWVLNNSTLSFQLSSYDASLPVTIDPLVYQWQREIGATGQTGSYKTTFNCITNDNFGNSYAIQNYAFAAGTINNGYLYKFNNNGTTLWSTSAAIPFPTGCAFSNNYVYVCGSTRTSSNVATTGAYQTTLAGQNDSYLMKFDSSGTKVWGTYYGGTGNDSARSCKADALGNIYVCGMTNSTAGISSVGAYLQSFAGIYDAFVAKFDSAGMRKWGTYFGGSSRDFAESIDINSNRIFVTGSTQSTSGIAIGTVQQSALSGNINAFLLCMDTAGTPQWSTYYGADSTLGENCVIGNGNVYLCGSSKATTNIATSGVFQLTNGGGYDAFLAKFNINGVRQWGTYYGGTGNETAKGNAINTDGSIFICGNTHSANVIATLGSFHPDYAVNHNDSTVGVAYLAELDTMGQRKYGTYFTDTSFSNPGFPSGGSGGCTNAEYCSIGNNGIVNIVGNFSFIYSDYVGYIAQFSYCNDATPVIISSATNICGNTSAQISTPAVAGAAYKWYRNDTLIAGAMSNIYNASIAGNYKVQLNNCPSAISSPLTINTYPIPATSITKTDAPCANAINGSIVVTASGGTPPYAYTWDNSANTTNTLSGLIPGNYVVHTSDVHSCTKHDTVVIANTMNSPSTQIAVTNVPCYGAPVGSIGVTASGGTPPYSYVWDNSANTTATLSGLLPGDYVVHTIDVNNCATVDSVNVPQDTSIAPSDPLTSICAVTVDSATGKNIVIWEKNGMVKAVAYNIYRETSIAGQYDLIGTQSVDDYSTILDATSIPLQQSYSYKIAEVDSCGHEWPQSDLHKTIHLSANVGVNGEVNLSWNSYEGKPYTTHDIMRSFNGGAFTLLNQVSSSITSYSDLTPPIGTSVYRIEIDLGTECAPSKPTSLQRVKSNNLSLSPTAINSIATPGAVQIVPNPTTGIINIIGQEPAQVKVYDATGRILMDQRKVNKVDISKYAKGLYMIRLLDKSGEIYYSQKIILK